MHKMKWLRRTAVALVVTWMSGTVQAVPIVSATGIQGLFYNGQIWDATVGDFNNQDILNIYTGYSLTVDTRTTYTALNMIVADTLNEQSIGVTQFNGCSDDSTCWLFSPTSLEGNLYFADKTPVFGLQDNSWTATNTSENTLYDDFVRDTDQAALRYTFVRTVPNVTTAALLIIGLTGLGISRRKRATQS